MAITVIPSVERCSECFTTVQFESSDVQQVANYDNYHYITCPCCGAVIKLDEGYASIHYWKCN